MVMFTMCCEHCTEKEYVCVPRMVIKGACDGYFSIERLAPAVGRARMSCTDRTAGRATISRNPIWIASVTCARAVKSGLGMVARG